MFDELNEIIALFSLFFTDDLEDVENEDLGDDPEDWHEQEERGAGMIKTQARFFLYICKVLGHLSKLTT